MFLLSIFWKYLKKYWYLALLASAFMVGEVFVDLYQPGMMRVIVDEGILGVGHGGVSDMSLVLHTGLKMLAVVIFGGLFGVLSGVFANLTGQRFGNDIRKLCFSRVMHFSFEQTDAFTTGSLITRVTNDVTQLQQMVIQMVRGMVRCFMFFVGGTTALLRLNLRFGVIGLCAFPVILLEVILMVRSTNPLFSKRQDKLDEMNGVMQEDVTGIRVVKAFVQEKREKDRFDERNRQLVDTQFDVQLRLSYLRPVMNIVLNVAVVGVIYIGSLQVQAGEIAPGSIMAAVTYIAQILNGMIMLAMIFQTLSRGTASARRLMEIIRTESSIRREEREEKPAEGRPGAVRFENVSLAYAGSDREVLRDIDLEIGAGETFAVIGATGCGKTSLVSLIPRFYDPVRGRVLVNGVDVRRYEPEALRDKVAMCLQKSELFSSTIRENIAMGDPTASEEEIRSAAIAAQADDFIQRQPRGYDEPVAEGGASLSGGQRQRIAIARALLKGGEILILDDSTSALDMKTEAKLYEALEKRCAGVTKIIIAQRVSSVRNADRIAVMDNGGIVACGPHEELIQTCDIYRDICESQLREEATEA